MEIVKLLPAIFIMLIFTGLYFFVGVKFIKKWRKKGGNH
ncbi:hypothetical protein SULYE_1081 [Sulfurihydrogenibium yellowstonense SS-5]|uniref:Uncharacterized protein n=1 Tax=Sulfurihydrogenibium yellowstonense SS-5 TaxID=432331 RepID=C4FKI1_9AQUI|nr:hypothetical protein SULYE_1081 [Sulfurihydrogenibium yellowstonense SS-5]